MRYNDYELQNLVKIRYGKNQKKVVSEKGKYPIYGTGGLMGYSTEYLYDKPSVLIGRKGTINKVKYIEEPFWTVDTLFYTEVDEEVVIPKYLYYLMSLINFNNYNEGTTIPSLRTENLNRIVLNIPTIDYQKKVLSILNPIDEKIENNNKINKNLEQQIQTIYLNFVAKYKTSTKTVKEITLAANTGADAIQKAPIVDYDTGIRCIRVGDMSNKRPLHEWGFVKVSPKIFKQYQLHKNDIVITRTASLGLNRIINRDIKAVYNNGLIRISINSDIILPLIVYCQFQTNDYYNYIQRISGETSVRPNMKIEYLLKYSFEVLDKTIQEKLIQVIQPMFEVFEQNIIENHKLSKLKDNLLPKLMSGELDVSNIDF